MSHQPGAIPAGQEPAPLEFDVRRFGAVGDGRTPDTEAINRAFLAAAAAGGGTVVLPAGDYLSHSIRLRSRVTLRFESGATLIAADPPPAGEPGGYDAPEAGPPNLFQDFGHSRFRNSLLWGEELEQVVLCGPGRIYGRGLSRGSGRIALPVGQVAPYPPDRLPDVLEADGYADAPARDGDESEGGPFGYPNRRDTLPAGVGNKTLALRGCRHVLVRDLTILHGGHFAILASDCDDLTLDNLLIDTNRDGIDIDGCANVRIARCSVNSPWDDGICLKSSCGAGKVRALENVAISDCYVSGFVEGTLYDGTRARIIQHRGGPIGRIKLGTEASGDFRNIAITNCVFEFCRGLALEQVDGAVMENIVVSNLTMHEVMNAPVFIRLGARLRAPGVTAPGQARRITIANVVAHQVAPEHGVFVVGLPGHPVCDVQLSGFQLYFRGGGTRAAARAEVPELPRAYPEPMLFGTLPAWGLYVRHAAGLVLRDISLQLLTGDERPAACLDDVDDVALSGIRTSPAGGTPTWVLVRATRLRVRDCDGLTDTPAG